MTTQNTQSAFFDIQSLLNPKGSQELFKTMASMNERMTAIFVEAGTRSVEIMSDTAKQSLSNLSDVAQVRDEPADYAKAYSAFAQKQMDLLKRSAQDVGDVTRKLGTETQEVTSEAREDVTSKVTASAKDTSEKFSADAKQAGETIAANAKAAGDTFTANAKETNAQFAAATTEATDTFKSAVKDAATKSGYDKTSAAYKKKN